VQNHWRVRHSPCLAVAVAVELAHGVFGDSSDEGLVQKLNADDDVLVRGLRVLV
jgi:hypothetical protein